jgi:hypothetical protein
MISEAVQKLSSSLSKNIRWISRGQIGRCASLLTVIAFLGLYASAVQAQVISVTVNGQPVVFHGPNPQQIEGRVLVPVRGVLEKLGADVSWVPQTHTVIASNGKIDIELKIGDRRAIVNTREVMLDVPAQVFGGSTFVPLRFLGEALGAQVGWDGPSHTVMIVTHDQPGSPPPDRDEHRPDRDEHRPHRPAPVINSFTQDARGWLRAGDTLHVLLEGTPGGQAAFRIPGLVDMVPMHEVAPGRYQGEWQLPNRPIQLAQAAVIGGLQVGDRSAQLIQAGQLLSVDAIPPQVTDRAPTPDTHVNNSRPNIYAVYEDQGSGIDPGSIRLKVNCKDVTGEFVSYNPTEDLTGGPQAVRIEVRDQAGNPVVSEWSFIEDRREQAVIRSVQDNATHALEPGDTLHVEIIGTPGGRADFSLANIRGIPLTERQPGHYVGDYTIRKGDDVTSARILVRLVTRDGARFEQQSNHTVTVRTGKPAPPVILSPMPNQRPSNPVVISGKATPNTKVHVRIDYSSQVLGVVGVKGAAVDTMVQSDQSERTPRHAKCDICAHSHGHQLRERTVRPHSHELPPPLRRVPERESSF